jgi:23S rRNA pseudouridine2605 synthase
VAAAQGGVAPRVPLARALSKLGAASRADAQRLVKAGRVAVNGRTARDPGLLVHPERDRIEVDGVGAVRACWRMLLLHKPRGFVTTRSDPDARPTVFDLLPADARRLVAVGRLDLATTGLLLFTSDTRLAAWLTDPENAVPRTYLVTVRGRLSDDDARRLEAGIDDDGERLRAVSVDVRKASGRESHAVVVLTQGRNREIRRLFEAIGHQVTALARVQFGGLALGGLPPGAWREIEAEELAQSVPGVQLRP